MTNIISIQFGNHMKQVSSMGQLGMAFILSVNQAYAFGWVANWLRYAMSVHQKCKWISERDAKHFYLEVIASH